MKYIVFLFDCTVVTIATVKLSFAQTHDPFLIHVQVSELFMPLLRL